MAESECPSVAEEDLASSVEGSKEDALFDETIGCIQDIILSSNFLDLQRGFMDEHYHHFEDKEENPLIYTDIFQRYTNLVERYIEKELKSLFPEFVMDQFMKTLESRRSEVPEEILDMLFTFTDFLLFKQMFLDYKAEKEGNGPDMGFLIVNSMKKQVH